MLFGATALKEHRALTDLTLPREGRAPVTAARGCQVEQVPQWPEQVDVPVRLPAAMRVLREPPLAVLRGTALLGVALE